MSSKERGRGKIELDPKVYCLNTAVSEGGKKDCEHDYQVTADEDDYIRYRCALCGKRITVEVWE